MKSRAKVIILLPLLAPLLVVGGQFIRKVIEAKRTVWILSAPYTPTLAFSPDSEMLAGGGDSHPPTLKIWQWKSGRLLHDIQTEHHGAITAMEFSTDGRTITTYGQNDGWLLTWDAFTGKKIRTGTPAKYITEAPVRATSSDAVLVAFPRSSNTIIVQHAKSRKIHRIFKTQETTGFGALAFSPNTKWLAASSSRKIYIWKVKS